VPVSLAGSHKPIVAMSAPRMEYLVAGGPTAVIEAAIRKEVTISTGCRLPCSAPGRT
jgi:hypothetical protein